MTELFRDEFNRADSPTVDGTNYTENDSSGSFEVNGNTLRCTGNSGCSIVTKTAAHAAIADVLFKVKRVSHVSGTWDGSIGVRLNSTATTGYFFNPIGTGTGLSAGIWRIDGPATGNDTQQGSDATGLTLGDGDDYWLKAENVGGNVVLTAYKNGTQILQVTDSSAGKITGAGQCGVIHWGVNDAKYDTLIVEDLATATLEQEGFRFGEDDANEAGHTFTDAQDTSITAVAGAKLLRALVNATGDQAATAYTLYAQKNGAGGYTRVPVGSASAPTLSFGAAGTIAVSASGGTTVAPTYPAGITTNSCLVLVVGQKPTTANGGTVTTPSGWTLRASRTGATDGDTGGYTTTIGADTGNCNIFVYTKDAVAGTETGTLTVTVGDNGVCFANIYRVEASDAATFSYAADTGKDTSAGNVSIATGSMAVASGDWILAGMVIPTDVSTPTQFSAEALAQTGTTFGTVNEVEEPDSTTGNDIGGFIVQAGVSSGSGSGAVTLTATAGGTTTNVRGPGFVLRIRATAVTFECYVSTSSNIAGGGEATTARLTAPSGKSTSDFVTGRRWDDENGTDTIDLTVDDYTEVEWSVTLAGSLGNGDYFEFRVYAGTTALNTYTLTPKWTIGSAAGAISGTATLALSPSGNLTAGGALSGSSTLTLSPSGTIAGAGAMSGTAALTLSPSGTITAGGAMSGSATLTLSPSGTLNAAGAMSGSIALALAPSGTAEAIGALAGSATLTLSPSGTIAAAGALSGSMTLTLAPIGAATGAGGLSGTATLTLSPSGTIAGAGAMSGTAALTLTFDGNLAPADSLHGNIALALSPSGTASGAGAMSGSATLTLSPSGTASGAGAMSGSATLALSPSGTLHGAGSLSGSSTLTFGMSGQLDEQQVGLVGSTGLSFSASGSLSADAALAGSSSIVVTLAGRLVKPCEDLVVNNKDPDTEDLVAVAFLDKYERFSKSSDDVAIVRLFYLSIYCEPVFDLTVAQYGALKRAKRIEIMNAPSAAGMVDTEGKSNA